MKNPIEDARKGLSRLIKLGKLEEAKSLPLELMKQGSDQVENSDERLMAYEIERCLQPVIRAVMAVGGAEAAKWAGSMRRADRVGFLCENELKNVRDGA